MMDEAKLEAFVTVAEEESFSAAADRLRVAQSTISSRIQGIESDLGQVVFSRTSRQVVLSPAGEAALPASRVALAALTSVREVVDDVVGLRRGRVRLGLVTGADLALVGETLAVFASDFPAIEIVVESAPTADLEQAVSSGWLDLAVVVYTARSDLRCHELMRDPLVVVGLGSEGGTVSVTDLGSAPLIVLDAAAGVRSALDSEARRADALVNVAVQVSTPDLARDLHSRGLGALVIPRSLAPGPGPVLATTGGDELSVHVGLISRPGVRTPAAELLRGRIVDGVTVDDTRKPAGQV